MPARHRGGMRQGAVINTFVRVANALAGAVLMGFAAGFAGVVLLTFAPCRWFGSPFEGGCGYGMVFAAIGLGLLVALLSFGVLLWRGFGTSPGSVRSFTRPSSKLVNAWVALLAMQYVAPLLFWVLDLSVGLYLGPLDILARGLLFASFIGASWVLFRRCGMPPALTLLVLVPLVGPLIVGALLWKPARAASSGTA